MIPIGYPRLVASICLAAILAGPALLEAGSPATQVPVVAAASPLRLIDPAHAPFEAAPAPPILAAPPSPIYDAREYGSTGDGVTPDTLALQKVIDACAGTGGTVCLARGKFLTAPLVLKAKMTLYINKDAALLGSTRPEDYPAQTAAKNLRKSLLFADKADHLVLDG